jgi:hypothetical protein
MSTMLKVKKWENDRREGRMEEETKNTGSRRVAEEVLAGMELEVDGQLLLNREAQKGGSEQGTKHREAQGI